jgi:hypothetical protein
MSAFTKVDLPLEVAPAKASRNIGVRKFFNVLTVSSRNFSTSSANPDDAHSFGGATEKIP